MKEKSELQKVTNKWMYQYDNVFNLLFFSIVRPDLPTFANVVVSKYCITFQ